MAAGEYGFNRAMRQQWRGRLKDVVMTRGEDDYDDADYIYARRVAKKLKARRDSIIPGGASWESGLAKE